MNSDLEMIKLLGSYGATWEMPIGLPEPLTYEDIVNTGIARSMSVLAAHGDVATAAARFSTNPALADDSEALKVAAENNQPEFVHLMLQYHPDLARRVNVSRPRVMAELLFANGMDPNRPNWLLIRPLHHFAEHGDLESAALFLEHGADLNAIEEEHESTPLGWAARSGQLRMVEFLLRRGARNSLQNQPAWALPAAWAAFHGHNEIVDLLTEYERSGMLPVHTREEYESLAGNLVEACHSARDEAVRPVLKMLQIERKMTWDRPDRDELLTRLRRFVNQRLGRVEQGELPQPSLDDARLLVATAHGFPSWDELMKSIDIRA
jgi:Ankyrin repeats (3 copies)